MSSPLEDKKCRLCGYTDQKNVNMFNTPNKGLVSKIRTVFPVLLYEHDPLPKYICKKCTATVSFMFLDIQRVMKMQQKWISNVRCTEPNNNYICILDMIESAHRDAKQSINTILHEEVPLESIERISLSFPTIVEQPPKRKPLTLPKREVPATTVTQVNNYSLPMHIKLEPTESKPNQKETQIVNGTTQFHTKRAAAVAAAVACTSQLLESEPRTRKSDTWHIKKEPPAKRFKHQQQQQQQQHQQQQTTTNNIVRSPCKAKQQLLKAPTIQGGCIKCPLCALSYKTSTELAAHQVLHLRLEVPKLFARKCLPKKERRGRLLNMNDKQCIRCLNCWRVFEDNKSILTHWSQKDCGFYCQICGKEFPHAPKMLREHVPAAHGVSYRSAKQQYTKYAPPLVESSGQKIENNTDYLTTMKSKEYQQEKQRLVKIRKSNPQKRAACSICNLLFHNMAARNSHMRKHKKKVKVELDEDPTEPNTTKQETTENTNDSTTMVHCELPLINIKKEPLEIDDISVKCQVCNNILTDSLEQHACF